MYTLYKFHFLNRISKINQLFDDILIIWPAPVDTRPLPGRFLTSLVDWKFLIITLMVEMGISMLYLFS